MAFGYSSTSVSIPRWSAASGARNLHKVPRDEYLKLMNTFTAKDFSGSKPGKS